MTAMPAINSDDVSNFSLLEMDNPSDRKVAPDEPTEVIELDLTEGKSATTQCLQCKLSGVQVDEQSICQACRNLVPNAVANTLAEAEQDDMGFGVSADGGTLEASLFGIAGEGSANASTQTARQAGSELRVVGFSNQEGYIQAIRNGVPEGTHREYMDILRNRYKLSGAGLAKLNLPGPMKATALPVGEGIKHVPTGPSIFDKPRAERAFIVGPMSAEAQSRIEARKSAEATVSAFKQDLVAGAAAEGNHAIIAWEGTSGMTRGELVGALKGIDKEPWAPKAPNARAQAGSAIATLGRGGLDVKALRKGASVSGADLATGEHVWTVGRIGHGAKVGDAYGSIVCRFKLSGTTLTFEGDAELANPVIALFASRMASELFKSSDVTSWLSRTMRDKLDGVRFGALGWLVPAKHVAAAKQLTEAIAHANFGTGWVHGLPVATSDQLRDGIVRGLRDEVREVLAKLEEERAEAKVVRANAHAAAMAIADVPQREAALAKLPSGDIGQTRAGTHLKDLRTIASRVVAYGAVLGEERVASLQTTVKDAMAELECVLGDDYSGIRERFALIWDEIEQDRKAAGGVL